MNSAKPVVGACVICGRPKDAKYAPFCSKRCSDVDLNRWFSGGYAVPAEEEAEPGEQQSQDK